MAEGDIESQGKVLSLTPVDRARAERDLQELIRFATALTGDETRVRTWLDLPLEAFRGLTARQLVEAGYVQGVRDYIVSISSGSVG